MTEPATDTRQLVLPFYVVVDVSYSMTTTPAHADSGTPPIVTANQLVSKVRDSLDANPILKDKVRFSIIDFSDDAQVVIPMCDLTTVQDIPQLEARGGTSFVAAFNTVRRAIESDVRTLQGDNHKVHRPAVFFLTDGEPTDNDADWQAAFQNLVASDFKFRPNVIPFGVAEAKKTMLDQIVYPAGRMRSFVMKAGADPGEAIRSMAEMLIGSVLASATSIHSQGDSGTFVPPEDEDEEWL